MFETPTIRQIPATAPSVLAFRISGKVTMHDMHAMAEFMGQQFAAQGKVDMLMILDHFEGTEFGAALDWTYIKTQFRALADVRRYAVVGAPRAADLLIEAMAHLTPIDARTFPAAEEAAAWAFVGAAPVG